MNSEQLTKVVEDYCNIDQPNYAIMVNGTWGVGKTFFIKNLFKKKNKPRLIYVSLFGITESNEIDDQIFAALFGNIDASDSEIKKAGDLLGKAFSAFGENSTGTALGAFTSAAGGALKNRALKNLGEGVVLVFDDLERAQISPYLCLSKINKYVEHQKLKVLILSDEEKIDDPKYFEYKEKVVLHTNHLERTTQEICTICFDAMSDFSHTRLDSFKSELQYMVDLMEPSNLRTIIHGLNCFRLLVNTATRLNPKLKTDEVLVQLLSSAIVLSIGYKDYCVDTALLEKSLSDLSEMSFQYYLKKEKNKTLVPTPWDRFYEHVIARTDRKVEFRSVFELVCKGHLSEEFLISDLERFTVHPNLDHSMTNVNITEQITDVQFEAIIKNAYTIVQNSEYSFSSPNTLFSFCKNFTYFYQQGATTLDDGFLDKLQTFSFSVLANCKDYTEIDDFQLHKSNNEFLIKLCSDLNAEVNILKNKEISQEVQASILNGLETNDIDKLESILKRDNEVSFITLDFAEKLLTAFEKSSGAELRLFGIFFEKRFTPGYYYEQYKSELPNIRIINEGLSKLLSAKCNSLSSLLMQNLHDSLSKILVVQKAELTE